MDYVTFVLNKFDMKILINFIWNDTLELNFGNF